MIQWATKLRKDELPLLARDADLVPDNADVQYRYGLALYLSGDWKEARARLQRAAELAPEVQQFALALRLLNERIDSSEKD